MHPNEELITKFYSSFQQLNGEGMVQCYHENIVFSDPVFKELKAEQAGAMWKMLCSQAKGFELSFSGIKANDSSGSAYWEAKYDFSSTGRQVHNKITAQFEFKDGKIIAHRDSFDFWKWSSMALGPVGILLGWTPLIKKKVQGTAMRGLGRFIEKSKAVS
jgi:limonene-1,2-epoxide hydrolase